MNPTNPKTSLTKAGRALRAVMLALALGLATAATLGGCAANGFVPDPDPMPVARAGLRPEYRLFYDALADYGDWKLIEPFGYAFRPRVAVDLWDPYQDGFWSPTDLYGWVWMSAEPFGWATYHYGRWYRDDYQGWVWIPGLDWAPAWVSWAADEQYVAWAPLAPGRDFDSEAPANWYRAAPRASMGSTDLATQSVTVDRLGNRADKLRPIANIDRADGVTFNRGPRVDWVEQVRGPIVRAQLQDLVPARTIIVPAEPRTEAPTTPREAEPVGGLGRDEQRNGVQAAQRARQLMQVKGSAPQVLPVVRPIGPVQAADDSSARPATKSKGTTAPKQKKSARGGG